MIPPRRLVLSGGGVKVVSIVGALKVLDEKGCLRALKEVIGVSAGAFLAFIVSTGCPFKKIEELILELNFGIIRNMSPEAFLGFPETFGIDDGKQLINFLIYLFRTDFNLEPSLTFQQHARTSKYRFRCWATDLNTRTAREFSVGVTPNVKIIDALRASMCLPMYFTPLPDPITGHLLSDGGIQGNLPLHHLTDDECQEAIAIGFCRKTPIPEDGEVPSDLMGFMNSIIACLTHVRNDSVLDTWSHMILKIPIDEYPSWNFEISRDDRFMLLETGITAARKWLNANHSRKILRRHSCQ
jgi:NTE family protein